MPISPYLLLLCPPLQRGLTWQQSMAAILSWAKGEEVTAQQVDACFPVLLCGKSQQPQVKLDADAVAGLGECTPHICSSVGQAC